MQFDILLNKFFFNMSMNKPLSILAIPSNTSQIIGREKELEVLKDFVCNYQNQSKKAVLLYGPSGSGKTSIVQALADEFGFEFFEINASDVRNKDQLQQRLAPALTQQSFFSKNKIILIDEVDGISGTYDRGGVQELVKLIAQSKYPVICTANDISHKKVSPLIKKSLLLAFEQLSVTATFQILQKVLSEHNIETTDSILKTIAIQSDGDIRAAINDVELLSQMSGKITEEDLTLLTERNRTETMQQVVETILKTTDGIVAKQALDLVSIDVDQQHLWLDYNTAFEYTKPADLARAYGVLSKANIYLSRIRKNQEWRFLVYVFDLLSMGVSSSKNIPYAKKSEIKQSSRLLKIWQINMSNAKRKIIAQKIAQKTHCSIKRAFLEVDFYKHIFQKNTKIAHIISKSLDLEQEDIAWLLK